MFKSKSQSIVYMNGKKFVSRGGNISISDNQIIIDGKVITDKDINDAKEIVITVDGNVDTIKCDIVEKIIVTGDCGEVKSSQGNVEVKGNVKGNARSSQGDVEVSGDVFGDVRTSQGSINCGNVKGSVKTSQGSIKYKK